MKLLRSKESTLAVLIIALVAQLPHAAYVFAHIGNQANDWLQTAHSYSYAIALELAVLLFVVRNKNLESYGFALVSVLINLSYYNMHEVESFTLAAFPAWLVSVALPVAIARYSHDIAHEAVAQHYEIVDSFAVPVAKLQAQLETTLAQHEATVAQLQATVDEIVEKQSEPVAPEKPTATQRRETLIDWLRNGVAINAAQVAIDFGVSAQLIRRELAALRNGDGTYKPAMAGD